MAKFKELTEKTDELIETGEKAKRDAARASAQQQMAAAAVYQAQRDLESASKTDNEGNTLGDVGAAKNNLALAQARLSAAARAVSDAQSRIEQNNSAKRAQIRKIQAHNEAERDNLAQLRRLQGMAFAENANGLQQGIVNRMNEANEAATALERSMGQSSGSEITGTAEALHGASYENAISNYKPKGTGARSAPSHEGGNSEGVSSADQKAMSSRGVNGVVASGVVASGVVASGVGMTGQDYANRNQASVGSQAGSISFVRDAQGNPVSKAAIANAYNAAKQRGDVRELKKCHDLYELVSFVGELDLGDGDPNFLQEGGFYGNTPAHAGYERHHMPSKAIQDANMNHLPSLTISKEHHSQTDSYRGRQNHRTVSPFEGELLDSHKVGTSQMIAEGRYIDLVRMEVYDLMDIAGHTYDGGLKQYFQAVYSMVEAGNTPEAVTFQEQVAESASTFPDISEFTEAQKSGMYNALYNQRMAKFLVEDGIVQSADFGNLDMRTVHQMAKTVRQTKEEFPKLELNFVGSIQARNNHIKAEIEQYFRAGFEQNAPVMSAENRQKWINESVDVSVKQAMQIVSFEKDTIAQSLSPGDSRYGVVNIMNRYSGISVNEAYGANYNYFVQVREKNVKDGFKPMGCEKPKATIDHELGHQIAFMGKAHENQDIVDVFSAFSKLPYNEQCAKLSGYATKDIHEFIAESWSEYRNNPKCRPLARYVAEQMINSYEEDVKKLVLKMR